jgi:hypothetical protein
VRAAVALWILAGCGRIGFGDHGDATAAAHEQRITIHGALVAESLANFTVYVHLDQLALPTTEIPNLTFLASDHATALAYEIEATTPDAFDVWVGVPQIAGETTIFVQYKRSGVLPFPVNAVWDGHFLGVWHFGDAHDSTLLHLDGVFTGTTAVPGVVGEARRLDHGWMTVAGDAALDTLATGTGLTIETWARPASAPALEYTLIGRETDAGGLDDFRLGFAGMAKLHGEITNDPADANFTINAAEASLGAWHQVALIRTQATGTIELLLDGASTAMVGSTGTLHVDSNPVEFGADCNSCGGPPDDDFFDGAIDEARISDIARSDAWLRAEYLNLTGSFVTVGPAS